MSHQHNWQEVHWDGPYIYYECSCGASKLVSRNTERQAKDA